MGDRASIGLFLASNSLTLRNLRLRSFLDWTSATEGALFIEGGLSFHTETQLKPSEEKHKIFTRGKAVLQKHIKHSSVNESPKPLLNVAAHISWHDIVGIQERDRQRVEPEARAPAAGNPSRA